MKEVIEIEDFEETREFPVGTHLAFLGDKFVIMDAGYSENCNECYFRTQFGGWCSSYINCLPFNRCDNKKERTKHHIGRFAKMDTKSFPRLYYAIDSLFDEYITDLKYIKVMAVESLAKEHKKVLAKNKKEQKKKTK